MYIQASRFSMENLTGVPRVTPRDLAESKDGRERQDGATAMYCAGDAIEVVQDWPNPVPLAETTPQKRSRS